MKKQSVCIIVVVFISIFLMAFVFSPGKLVTSVESVAQAKGTHQKLPVIKLGLLVWPGVGPFFIAKEKGFYQEQGIDVEISMIENVDVRRSALLSDKIDIVAVTLDMAIIDNGKGVDETIIGITDFSTGADGILVKSDIKKLEDLKDKKIALPEGQTSHFFLLYLLDRIGLGPDDFTIIPTGDAGQAGFLFSSGGIKAAVTWEPWLYKTVQSGKGTVLISTKEEPELLVG
ncbi:ABC transporter substrate-binding protein, partial [Thermodesulfobacteriota bacterium]